MKIKRVFVCIFYISTILTITILSTVLNGCNNKTARSSSYKLTGNDLVDGKNLAQLHCSGCHSLVPVNTLTKDVWINHILPDMSSKLGIYNYAGNQYYLKDSSNVMSLNEWSKIVTYYQSLAPAELSAVKVPEALQKDWSIFSLKKPAESASTAFTTLTAVDPFNNTIYTSDLQDRKLLAWDNNLKSKPIADLQTTAVAADFIHNDNTTQGVFTSVGLLEDADVFLGKTTAFNLDNKKDTLKEVLIASGLPRPVNTVHADFNKDGLTDFVISCNGGPNSGGVYLFTQTSDHQYKQTKLRVATGAIQAITGDFNNDGWPDLMALFGKSDEGVWLFLNNHDGSFSSRNLLRFPAVYGSSSFQIIDFNKDGQLDIVYTCGNNFGDSRILKPYHGVYIFLNQGNFKFKQNYFYPINGCTKAIAADFNQDGKLDIATIAFFADLKNNPAEGFIYFEQDKPLHFIPHAVPISGYGRWKTMDTINHNGKSDLVLGNYASGFKIQDIPTSWNKNLPFIVLENKTSKTAKL
jgi:hypothetical protein